MATPSSYPTRQRSSRSVAGFSSCPLRSFNLAQTDLYPSDRSRLAFTTNATAQVCGSLSHPIASVADRRNLFDLFQTSSVLASPTLLMNFILFCFLLRYLHQTSPELVLTSVLIVAQTSAPADLTSPTASRKPSVVLNEEESVSSSTTGRREELWARLPSVSAFQRVFLILQSFLRLAHPLHFVCSTSFLALSRLDLVYNSRKRGGDSADRYFKSTELVRSSSLFYVRDFANGRLMADVLSILTDRRCQGHEVPAAHDRPVSVYCIVLLSRIRGDP